MGVLEKLGGILFGKPGGQIPPEMFQSYDDALCNTIRVEYGLDELPIVTNMDLDIPIPCLLSLSFYRFVSILPNTKSQLTKLPS